MAETFPNDVPAENSLNSSGSPGFPSAFPGQPGAPPELPETSAVRASNAQLNRSAEAVGRRVGNAVAGVRSIPQQVARLRSRIHLEDRYPEPDRNSTSLAEVAGDWRDAVEGSVSEMSQAANCYRVELLDRATERLLELQRYGERSYYRLRSRANARVDKVRRMSQEEPLQFIAGCAAAAFALGMAMRVWRSNYE